VDLRLELWLSLALAVVIVGVGVKKHGLSKVGKSPQKTR